MDPKLAGKLIVAISSRALFDLDEANRVYDEEGLERYREYTLDHENEKLDPGTGFPLVQGLLSINHLGHGELIEVVLVSRNDADTGLRVMNSVEYFELPISRAVFTGGRPPYAYLESFSSDLFLSAHPEDVGEALEAGFAAGLVYKPPYPVASDAKEVRIAFDGDAVLFSPDAEDTYRQHGLAEFHRQERESADIPLTPGPFKGFLEALHKIQKLFPVDDCPIHTSLVTARSMPAHKRAIKTLRAWDVRVNEAFFLGGMNKQGILEVFRPHIFFDDQPGYCDTAAVRTPTARVPARSEKSLPMATELTADPHVNGVPMVESGERKKPRSKRIRSQAEKKKAAKRSAGRSGGRSPRRKRTSD